MSGLGFIEPMTSSNTLKKIVAIGAAMLLAVGGSLTAASPAQATGLTLTSAPTFTPATAVSTETSMSASYGSWANAPLGTGGGSEFWRICDSDPSLLSAVDGTDVPVNLNCQIVFTSYSNNSEFTGTGLTLSAVSALGTSSNTVSTSSLVGKYIARISIVKLYQSPYTLYGWAFSSAKLIQTPPTMTGPSGNVNGSVGVAMSMGTYVTTGLTSPVVYSYAVAGGQSLPAGVTFDTTTGQITGTPTASASNLSVTVTATGANGLSKSSVFNYTVTGGSGGGGGGVSNCNPAITVTALGWSSASIGTSGTVRTIYNNDPSIGTSTLCFATMVDMSVLTTLNGVVVGTPTRYPTYGMGISSSQITLSMLLTNPSLSSLTINDGDVYTNNYYVSLGRVPTLSDTPTFSRSLILNPGVAGSSVVSTPQLSVEQARNVLKPVPAAVQPLVPGFLALNKPMASLGGKVALSAGDFTGLVSAKIAGKSLDFILGNTGKITMTVPQGEAGKTADLHLTFNTGSIILQDAIKYVAPLDIAKVGVRPISIAAGAKKITDGVADQIRQAAFANLKNDTIQCIAYSANNSSAATAAAKLTAVQACAVAVKANPDLKVADVSVIVDKLKARTQGVGIKVYKADN